MLNTTHDNSRPAETETLGDSVTQNLPPHQRTSRRLGRMKNAPKWAGAALIVGGMCVGVLAAPAAHAAPRCLFQGDWNCEGPPQWNGQLQNTWDVPPYTWPKGQLQCDPYTTRCYPVSHP